MNELVKDWAPLAEDLGIAIAPEFGIAETKDRCFDDPEFETKVHARQNSRKTRIFSNRACQFFQNVFSVGNTLFIGKGSGPGPTRSNLWARPIWAEAHMVLALMVLPIWGLPI